MANYVILDWSNPKRPGFLADTHHLGRTGKDTTLEFDKAVVCDGPEDWKARVECAGDRVCLPVPDALVEALPFEMETLSFEQLPFNQMSEKGDRQPAPSRQELKDGERGVILTPYGFVDEKYNTLTETSRPKVRSFALDYANLYTRETLPQDMLTEDATVLVLPEELLTVLQDIPEFSPKVEPYGFFMEPCRATEKAVEDVDLDMADLEDLSEEQQEDLPWEL